MVPSQHIACYHVLAATIPHILTCITALGLPLMKPTGIAWRAMTYHVPRFEIRVATARVLLLYESNYQQRRTTLTS